MNILISMFSSILSKLPGDVVKKALDKALDVVESSVAKSETKIDDQFVLPAIQWLRQQLGIAETPGSGFEDN